MTEVELTKTAVPLIDNWQLALALIFVLASAAVSALFRLGLAKSLAWGVVRTFVQLTVMGYALHFLFEFETWWVSLGVTLAMCLVALRAVGRRTASAPERTGLLTFAALTGSTYLVSVAVCSLIIQAEPWYAPRVVIPITGMVLGNAMNSVSIGAESLFAAVRERTAEIETRLALGATAWEAARPLVRQALKLGLTPSINSLMTVGLVSIPGMMTGQILSGTDPRLAVRYQIVVMLMIVGAASLGCLAMIGLGFRKAFTKDQHLTQEFLN